MGILERFTKKYGNSVAESAGVRNGQPPVKASPPRSIAGPEDGRTRAPNVANLDITRIDADPTQPRKQFDEAWIDQIATSLKRRGQLQPIRVRWNPALTKYVVVGGEQRHRAAIKAGLKSLLCVILDGQPAAADVLEEQLAENIWLMRRQG